MATVENPKPARLIFAVLLLSSVVVTSGSAQAAPVQPGAGAAKPWQTHRVTLVTGDTVDYTETGTGRRAVSIQAAPRPDRAPVVFETVGGRDDYFVIPSDAEPYLADGVLDRALFDVADLVRDGLDNASADAVPVLVSYAGRPERAALAGAAAGLPGVTDVEPVPTAGVAGVAVSHDKAGEFWSTVTASGKPAFAGGVATLRLDRTVRVALDQSVPMIGAPTAWAAGLDGRGVTVGVVDTGIDANHPDVAGTVLDSANFTGEPDTSDTFGHGTHVASTIVSSGKASDGRYKGVAPGAKLVVAKVFDASGTAPESQVMAGMEWAATHGAKIVNMSLGSGPTDGTDPVSLLVDELTARTGTLFVVASGNLGGDRSVTSPGAATSALTVGAVDKQDVLAPFAGKGPRLGDGAVKPEIVAPGVAIVAARAAGTSMGNPVNDLYTSSSGTSMATPHVAGAAAIVAQQHPDWPAARLKDALVSTARDDGNRWFQQGAGRLDVGRVVTQPATATGSLSAGRLARTGVVTSFISYTNDSAAPLTLRLALDVRGWNGAVAPAAAVRLDATSVVVPARSQSRVSVTIDPSVGEVGVYGGVVTANSADRAVSLRTPLSYYVPSPTGPITVVVRDSHGRPVTDRTAAVFSESAGTGNDPLGPEPLQFVPLNTAAQLPLGRYSVSGSVREVSLSSHRWTALVANEVAVTGSAAEVTLDARDAVPIGVTTPRPTEQRDRTAALRRHLPGTSLFVEWQFIAGADATWQVYATPAPPARTGTVSFQDYWTRSERQLEVRPRGGAPLAPLYDAGTIGAKLAGTHALPLVWVGAGRQEDFAAIDARGTLALAAIPDPGPVADPITAVFLAARTVASNAAGAGATGVVVYVDAPGALPVAGLTTAPVVQLSLNQAEGAGLRARLGTGPVTLDLVGLAAPGYMYNLSYNDDNGIPAAHIRPVDVRQLVPIETSYHADKPGIQYAKQWTAFPPLPGSLAQRRTTWTGPARWTEYLGPVDARVAWQRRSIQTALDGAGRLTGELAMFAENVFRPNEPRRSPERWFAAPLRNGALTIAADHPVRVAETSGPGWERHCSFCRGFGEDPDQFVPALHFMDSGAGHFVTIWQNGRQYFNTTTTRLFKDGKEIPPDRADPFRTFPLYRLPAEPGKYRLTAVDAFPASQRGGPSLALFRLTPRTETTWEFTSRRPTGRALPGYGCEKCAFQPLIQLNTQLTLDLNNQAPANRDYQFTVNAGHHVGTQGGAPLVGITVQYSTDDGRTWSLATVRKSGPDSHLVTVHHPPLSATSGYVWLRIRAWDTAGNWVDQLTQRAYALT